MPATSATGFCHAGKFEQLARPGKFLQNGVMPAWLYAAIAVSFPALWSVAVAALFRARDKSRAAARQPAPVDYSI